jgi:hypothetical protein
MRDREEATVLKMRSTRLLKRGQMYEMILFGMPANVVMSNHCGSLVLARLQLCQDFLGATLNSESFEPSSFCDRSRTL